MLSSQSSQDLSSPISSLTSLSEDSLIGSSQFSDLEVKKMITQAKFTIFLAQATSQPAISYALKLFPLENMKVSSFFSNEIRFHFLNHKNVLAPIYHEAETDAFSGPNASKASFILTEYAPNGDFFDLLADENIKLDDTIVKTYFHQLIEGLEYLHNQGVSHLDLKLENLLLDKDYKLKICDFDLAYLEGDSMIKTAGTPNYRSPELMEQQCQNPRASDIYSVAIVLFALKCCGVMPYLEDEAVDLFELLMWDPKKFWLKHCRIQGKTLDFWGSDFMELFNAMTCFEARDRPTIEEIKNSAWYKGPILTDEDLAAKMKQVIRK